jgi:hypothetical protein
VYSVDRLLSLLEYPTRRRRGDVRVHKDGMTWVVDVGVVCPGTTRYVGEGAATVPGTAAAV